MKRNLTRETRRADDSLKVLQYVKSEMQKKQREILALQNELQKALKKEMDSKSGEILALQDKLQGSKTVLLDYQNRSRAKFEEQQINWNLTRLRWKSIKMRR